METNKIREYIMVKDEYSHPKLDEVGCYNYDGELKYTDHIYDMLSRAFKMDRLITEVSYVIAFDHTKTPKGICKVGQGGLGETPTPMQSIFTFLLLAGASSFIVAHNHISDMPEASESDKIVSSMIERLASDFNMEFIGHMIINPNGYIIDGGTMGGLVAKLDEEGEISSWNSNEEFDDEAIPFSVNEIQPVSENLYETIKSLRESAKGR